MRPATVTAAAVTTLVGAGAAAVAAGRYAGGVALKVPSDRPLPGESRLTVHATAAGQISLTRDLTSLRPGTWGLAGPGGVHAVVGPVLDDVEHSADTVVRRLERVTGGTLDTGARVRITPQLHTGDPTSALGLEHRDETVPGELGPLPAWQVPALRSTWVIAVHGLGTTRAHTMNLMDFWQRMRLPVLAPAYRGDPGAPRPRGGLGHLGDSEWRDLDAAIRHAMASGAERVILHGWSTGAAMALHAADRSELREVIGGLVLDSPVLDWETTLRALAGARRVPAALLPLAVRAAKGTTGVHGDRLAEAAAPDGLSVPTLVFHGPADRVAPWSFSRDLAARRPDLVTLHTVRDAPHAAMWNADPARYEENLRRFLVSLV
ncbi:alpha/beta hydrolase [Streptomyces sp. NPDC046887]|uniref:alpha/beta hydrolase n=1 Tax=Streptomyces sp. NPDC046887 TaxID=3155472 RepID=UPI0033C046C1